MEKDRITAQYIDDVFMRVDANKPEIVYELIDYFKFRVPGYRFMPKYKAGIWDGYVSLYKGGKLPTGLLDHLKEFADGRDYDIVVDPKLQETLDISHDDFVRYVKSINLPFEARDYQIAYAYKAIKNKRLVVVSPTGSGKSLIIYIVARFLADILPKDKKILIVVPRVSLVFQLYSDFKEYGYDAENNVAKLGGRNNDKIAGKRIVISTWQSIYKRKPDWFQKFGALIIDECHSLQNLSAKAIKSICHKTTNCPFKIGFTGTVRDLKVAKLELQGLLGKIYQITNTQALIDRKMLAPIKIKCVRMNYKDAEKKEMSRKTYQSQVNFVEEHAGRLNAIANIAIVQSKNTLILFEHIDYGKRLKALIEKKLRNKNIKRNVYFIYGAIDGEKRERVRKIMERERDAILIASYGTFSTGINIRNIHTVIFSSAGKSKIRVLQSIGRGLRTHKNKDELLLIDIFDDLTWGKKINYSAKHFIERAKFYDDEGFLYEIVEINL